MDLENIRTDIWYYFENYHVKFINKTEGFTACGLFVNIIDNQTLIN